MFLRLEMKNSALGNIFIPQLNRIGKGESAKQRFNCAHHFTTVLSNKLGPDSSNAV